MFAPVLSVSSKSGATENRVSSGGPFVSEP